jgi:hypothetical protein
VDAVLEQDRQEDEAVTYSRKIINGVVHVWSIMDNAWVTLEYWEYINGRKTK